MGEPFIALNEAYLVYAKHPDVISALRKMHEELGMSDKLDQNLLNLIKAMSEAAEMPISHQLNDDFTLRPFTPPPKKTCCLSPSPPEAPEAGPRPIR